MKLCIYNSLNPGAKSKGNSSMLGDYGNAAQTFGAGQYSFRPGATTQTRMHPKDHSIVFDNLLGESPDVG